MRYLTNLYLAGAALYLSIGFCLLLLLSLLLIRLLRAQRVLMGLCSSCLSAIRRLIWSVRHSTVLTRFSGLAASLLSMSEQQVHIAEPLFFTTVDKDSLTD